MNREDLTENVAKGIVVKVKKKRNAAWRRASRPATRPAEFSAASLEPAPKGLAAETAAAQALGALDLARNTGARVNEITQLTPADFGIEEGFDYIRLDATATKTGSRKVPLREHLLERGCSTTSGPAEGAPCSTIPSARVAAMDFTFGRSASGSRSGCAIRSASWTRRLRPNHGWRHRFSSLARAVDMHVDVQNILQGHVGRENRFRLRRRVGVDSPPRDIEAAAISCRKCQERIGPDQGAGYRGLDQPFSVPISDSEEVLPKFRLFSNRPFLAVEHHGGE